MVREKIKPSRKQSEDTGNEKELVLFNDDVNSFTYVITTLVEVCHHDPEQAEQCAMIAHYSGKCGIKSGNSRKLIPYHRELSRRGLTVKIE